MLVPRRFEPVIVLCGVLNGVFHFSGDTASGVFEPIDQNDRIVEMLRLRHLLIGSHLTDIFAGFGAVYLYTRRRVGTLTDQFAGEIEVGNASSLNAEIFHIFILLFARIVARDSRADKSVCRRNLFISLFFNDLA